MDAIQPLSQQALAHSELQATFREPDKCDREQNQNQMSDMGDGSSPLGYEDGDDTAVFADIPSKVRDTVSSASAGSGDCVPADSKAT